MAIYRDREHFIPLESSDLVEFLVSGKGSKSAASPLSSSDASQFRTLADLLAAYFHREFLSQFRGLKSAYSLFDPDKDTLTLTSPSADERDKAVSQLTQELQHLLEKANYRELTRIEMIQTMQGHSLWGLEMDVCWEVFEHLQVYYRGDTFGKRSLRRWWKFWRLEEKTVPEFNRLVLVLKLRPHKRLGSQADTQSVYIKMFKDMPKADLEMVLPGTRLKLSRFDKGMIVYPLASGLALVLYKILADVIGFRDILALAGSISLSWSLAVMFAGYGYKSYLSYSNKKTEYTLQLTQSLYFQNIDSNAGVFYRLLDEAEEQESREALLAYFWLWKRANGQYFSSEMLDDAIEEDLEARLGLKVDFEIADALLKLERLALVRKDSEGRYAAIPIDQALQIVAAR